MDKLLQAALERRDALRSELEAIEELVMRLQKLEQAQVPAASASQQPAFRFVEPRRKGLTPDELDMVLLRSAELILEANRPLTRSELLQRLLQEGFPLHGGDKAKVLGTNLWRSGRFRNVKGSGYWPNDRPLPDGFSTE